MQIIQQQGVTASSHGMALNKLAVTKKSYPLYFYISTTEDLEGAITATKTDTQISVTTGTGLSVGDYFRIGTAYASMSDEVLMVHAWLTGDTVMIAKRAQLGTTAEAHAKDDLVFARQDGFTNTQLGAGTATIAESRTVWDLGDASFYDLSMEVQCFCDQDYSSDFIVLNYAFSGFSDLALGAVATDNIDEILTNTKSTLTCTYPVAANVTSLHYETGNIKPTARYMYVWVTGHADLDDAQTTAKIRLNTV
jgi:hypothetical protein